MKNILFIASDNAKTSGAFLCMVKLCELLKKNYNCNVIVVLPGIGDGKPLLDEIGVKTYMVKSCTWAVPNEWSKIDSLKFEAKMMVYNYPAIRKIRSIIRSEKIHIVHINTSWTYVGAVAALKEKVKLVWHIRECMQISQNRHIPMRQLGYSLLNQSDRIIVISDFVYDTYHHLQSDKLVKIYEGIEIYNYYQKREILKNNTVNILILGLLCEQKGQNQVIEAARILYEQKIDNINISIVGRGLPEERRKLTCLVDKYNLNEIVKFYDATSNPDEYYKNADIFIMASTAEAFGRTTVEAMLEGCLVIGADSGATTELLDAGFCGLLYKPGDVKKLAEKIIYAINNREQMRQLAKKGQEFAYNNFTAEKNAQLIHKLYEDLG